MTTTNALLDALRDMDDDDLRELAYGVGCTANELWDLVLRPMNELYDEVLDARSTRPTCANGPTSGSRFEHKPPPA